MAEGLDSETFQRLVLANQYEMMASLDPDPEASDSYLDLARQIRDWWPLDRLRPVRWMHEMREDPLTAEDQDLVRDALELFDALQRADRDGRIDEADRSAVSFPGFCGNYETKFLGYLTWLREHALFAYVRLWDSEDPNSHMPMIDMYERMIAKWGELGRPRELGAAEAAVILGERRCRPERHPAYSPLHHRERS